MFPSQWVTEPETVGSGFESREAHLADVFTDSYSVGKVQALLFCRVAGEQCHRNLQRPKRASGLQLLALRFFYLFVF